MPFIEIMALQDAANSFHVTRMFTKRVGLAASWNYKRSATVYWHAAVAIYVGSGISDFRNTFAFSVDYVSQEK